MEFASAANFEPNVDTKPPEIAMQLVPRAGPPSDFPVQAGDFPDVIAARHEVCLSLVEQLAGYCVQKEIQRSREALAERLEVFGTHPKDPQWEVSPVELQWCKEQVIKLLAIQEAGEC